MLGPAPRIQHVTAHDGYRYAVRIWDAARPLAHVVCVHGIVSHGGWYLGTCRLLSRAGFEVHFLDRRGSGLNAEARGDVDSVETWLIDVKDYVAALPKVNPRVLLGISWGGKLVAAFARRHPDLIGGIAMICPGLFARQAPDALRRTLLAAAGLGGAGRSCVQIPLRDPALFTDSPYWRAYVSHDPLALRRITIRCALADSKLTSLATAAPGELTVPLLFVLAGRDRIVDNIRTRAFFQRIAAPDKELLELPHAAHTLDFEPDASAYVERLCQWLRRVAATKRPSI
jgi:alpha-beta hydrolase superfamily lysophospholipase